MTLEEFKTFCDEIIALHLKVAAMDEAKKAESKKLEIMKLRAAEHMDELNIDKLPTRNGTISIKAMSNPKVVDRFAFHDYLRKHGLYDDMTTVNAATAKAFYKEEKEKALKAGDFGFMIPGMEISSTCTTTRITGAK